jgi:hypothetical protein
MPISEVIAAKNTAMKKINIRNCSKGMPLKISGKKHEKTGYFEDRASISLSEKDGLNFIIENLL